MLNVRRKFKADTDELYSRRHHELSIGEYRDDIYRYSREIEVRLLKSCRIILDFE